MRDESKTKKQLVGELVELRRRVAKLEASETERRRAEKALGRSEEAYRLLFEQSVDGIVIVAKGRIVRTNHAFCTLHGWPVEETIGASPLDLIHPDDREMAAYRIQAILSGETVPESRTYRSLRPDGSVFWAEVRSQRIEWEGEPALQSIVRDITARKQAEEALKGYSEKLEEMVEQRTRELREAQEALIRREKLATLGQLAGGVGHELRNPLSVISNAIYFLQMALADADETTKEYLDIIYAEIHNSEKIIADLLDFSRTRFPEKERVTVANLIARVLQKRPPPDSIEVVTEIGADLPAVLVDPRQIGQVLGNLVTNAYQAMPEGGRLTITAQAKDDEVSISIADTGYGISQENMGKLFKPLFTTKERGIGLGLTVSKSLVEANGGSIEAWSEEGRGSTFAITLPRAGDAPGNQRG